MPIPQLTINPSHFETDPQKLLAYAKHFEKMSQDKNLKSFKKDLQSTAKNLRQQAHQKLINPLY